MSLKDEVEFDLKAALLAPEAVVVFNVEIEGIPHYVFHLRYEGREATASVILPNDKGAPVYVSSFQFGWIRDENLVRAEIERGKVTAE